MVMLLAGCASQPPQKTVTIYTFIYPPYTDYGPSGMFIDLITEAYKTQGIKVKFEFDTLTRAAQKAKRQDTLFLASRRYSGEFKQEVGYEELYSVNTNFLSIEGRAPTKIMGAFSSDEVQYAQDNNLRTIKYTTPKDGLKLLYQGKVGSIVCTDISCDQIQLSNPKVKFKLDYGYSFSVDLVYFHLPTSTTMTNNLKALRKGINKILNNGKYQEIQNSYKVSNPIFQIPLENLFDIEIGQ